MTSQKVMVQQRRSATISEIIFEEMDVSIVTRMSSPGYSPLCPPVLTLDTPTSFTQSPLASSQPDVYHATTARCAKGKLFLGSVQAVFALGGGDNRMNIRAVLSCVPEVNENINELVTKANVFHHDYFLIDDHDALLHENERGNTPAQLGAPEVIVHSPVGYNPSSKPTSIFGQFDVDGDRLPQALAFIHANRLAGRNVLVHCDGGVLRSPATVISYLMAYAGKTMNEAKQIVTQCRPEVHVRPLEDCLSALEKSLQLPGYASFSTCESSANCTAYSSFEHSSTPRVKSVIEEVHSSPGSPKPLDDLDIGEGDDSDAESAGLGDSRKTGIFKMLPSVTIPKSMHDVHLDDKRASVTKMSTVGAGSDPIPVMFSKDVCTSVLSSFGGSGESSALSPSSHSGKRPFLTVVV